MGYRPNLVKKYSIEYGDTLTGFNHRYDEFSEFLEKLGVEFYDSENQDKHYAKSADLIALEKRLDKLGLDEDELENTRAMIEVAKNSRYAKDDFVMIEWY